MAVFKLIAIIFYYFGAILNQFRQNIYNELII